MSITAIVLKLKKLASKMEIEMSDKLFKLIFISICACFLSYCSGGGEEEEESLEIEITEGEDGNIRTTVSTGKSTPTDAVKKVTDVADKSEDNKVTISKIEHTSSFSLKFSGLRPTKKGDQNYKFKLLLDDGLKFFENEISIEEKDLDFLDDLDNPSGNRYESLGP